MSEGFITIAPFNESRLEDANYELSVGSSFMEAGSGIWSDRQSITLAPKDFVLAKSQEKIKLSPSIAALVFTRGSWARKGIDVAQSSCFCEPNTNGELTLEISNQSNQPITLRSGDTVAKVVFVQVI